MEKVDVLLEKATQEIAKNHRKIIDDWCKAYLSQLYQENGNIKPGCFILHQQEVREGNKIGYKYWFEPKNS